MTSNLKLEVKGIPELVNRLSKFDKDVYKVLTKEVRQGMSAISNDAKARTPNGRALSGWGPWTEAKRGKDLGFRGQDVKRGIAPQAVKRSKRGQVVKFAGRVVTRTPAGAIFAMAGSDKGTSGDFQDALGRYGNDWPRTLTAALYAKGPRAARDIEAAIQKAAASVTGRRL
jgi:hypothetical protein